jgi:uncharacterized protein (DUF1501 family)
MSSHAAMRNPASPSRRRLLGAAAGVSAAALGARAWAQDAPLLKDGRLVLVFLRGAYDGLSAAVPYADPEYARIRPSLAIPAPDGAAQTALRLDQTFALHPALGALLPLWQQGVLTFIPAAGSPDPTRSHFEAQVQWEIGLPGRSNAERGWLNTLAGMAGGSTPVALGVGEANPKILAGPAQVKLIPKGPSAAREGVLHNERARSALFDMYGGQDDMSKAFRQGAVSRMVSAQELMNEMNAADNGAAGAAGLALDAQHLGTLMRSDRRLRLGFLSAGGWDTHANQGAATGLLAQNLANLAAALVQLRRDFSGRGDVIAVVSEFGRTAAENGTRGTDHGHGNALWLIGDRINGGRWHGQWSGLARGNLNEGRDLPVHHDFRAVFAQVLRAGFGLAERQLQEVFPGASLDARLRALVRTA